MTRNLARLAEETHERRGDYEALSFEGRWYSTGELFERGTRLDLGVEPGDRVVVMMENSPDVGAVWAETLKRFIRVMPLEYKRALEQDASGAAIKTELRHG